MSREWGHVSLTFKGDTILGIAWFRVRLWEQESRAWWRRSLKMRRQRERMAGHCTWFHVDPEITTVARIAIKSKT